MQELQCWVRENIWLALEPFSHCWSPVSDTKGWTRRTDWAWIARSSLWVFEWIIYNTQYKQYCCMRHFTAWQFCKSPKQNKAIICTGVLGWPALTSWLCLWMKIFTRLNSKFLKRPSVKIYEVREEERESVKKLRSSFSLYLLALCYLQHIVLHFI